MLPGHFMLDEGYVPVPGHSTTLSDDWAKRGKSVILLNDGLWLSDDHRRLAVDVGAEQYRLGQAQVVIYGPQDAPCPHPTHELILDLAVPGYPSAVTLYGDHFEDPPVPSWQVARHLAAGDPRPANRLQRALVYLVAARHAVQLEQRVRQVAVGPQLPLP